MELETLNKLYLELSHVATVRTSREVALEALLARVNDALGAANAVALRDGQGTNWLAFRARLRRVFDEVEEFKVQTGKLQSAICHLQSAIKQADHD